MTCKKVGLFNPFHTLTRPHAHDHGRMTGAGQANQPDERAIPRSIRVAGDNSRLMEDANAIDLYLPSP